MFTYINKQVTSTEIHSDLIILIKNFVLANAQGDVAPPCLIISIPGMDPEEFYHGFVKGLVHSTVAGGRLGGIYACLTKCGNDALFGHWFINVAIPWISDIDNHYQAKDCFGEPQRILMKIDGELCILRNAFSENVRAALKEQRIDGLKSSPGCTRVGQELDASTLFRDTKSVIKAVIRNGVNYENDFLSSQLDLWIADLKVFLRERGRPQMTLVFSTKLKRSVQLVTYALKKAVDPTKMALACNVTGLQKQGLIPVGGETTDFEKLLEQCPNAHKIPVPDWEKMIANKEIVGLRILSESIATNEFLDELGIYKLVDAKDRDNFQIDKCYSFIFTSDRAVERYQANEARKAADVAARVARTEASRVRADAAAFALTPAGILAKANAEALAKQQAKDDREDAKIALKAATDYQKAVVRAAEVARVAALSAEEKKAEKGVQKREREVKKQRAIDQRAQENADREGRQKMRAAEAATSVLEV